MNLNMDPAVRVRLLNDGKATFVPTGPVTINCDLNVMFFPFDNHNCYFLFESIRYTTAKQRIFAKGLFLEYGSLSSGEWDVTLGGMENSSIIYSPNGIDRYEFARAKFSFTLTRKPAYYTVSLMVPLLSISFVEFSVYFQPIDSLERLPLSLTVLLAFSFFSSTIISELPHKSDNMPLLLIVANTYMAIIAFVTILQALTIYFANREVKGKRSSNVSGKKHSLSNCLNKFSIAIYTITVAGGTILSTVVLPFNGIHL